MAETLRELVGASNKIVYPSATAVIKQASPSSVFANPATLEAFSNANNLFDSTTLGTKTILAFAGGIPANSNHQLVTGYAQHPLSALTSMTAAFNVTGAGSALQVHLLFRIRPITNSSFDPTTVTYNSFMTTSIPTFGAAVISSEGPDLTLSGNVSTTNWIGRTMSFAFSTTATMYALALDCCVAVAATGGGTIVSQSNAFTTVRQFPYLIRGS